jgi:predicted unusual protein kinase regulating ubiquinone biosynthesis (AarF/ABC1/UbiB family)
MARIEVEAVQSARPEPADVDVRLALIDFGMTARLSSTMREKVTRLLMALGDHRGDDVAATLIEMGEPQTDFDRVGYTRAISALVARNLELTAAEVQAGRLLFDVIDLSFRSGLRLPAEMTLLAKALFNLDGVTRALEPSYTPLDTIREFGNQIAVARAQRDMSPRRIYQIAMESSDLLAALPHRLDQITQRLANNDLGARVEVPQLAIAHRRAPEGREPCVLGPRARGPARRERDAAAVLAHARHSRLRHRCRARPLHRADDHGERSGQRAGVIGGG